MNYGTNFDPNMHNGAPPPQAPPPPGVVPPPYNPVQPGYAAVPPMYVPQPIVPRRQYGFAQKLMALAMFFFGYLFMRVFVFEDGSIGRTVFTLLLLLASAGYMAHTGVKPGAASVLAGILTGVLSLGFAFGLPDGLGLLLTAACALCYTYYVYKAYDTGIERFPGRFLDFDLMRALFAAPFSSFGSVFPAVFSTTGEKNKRISKKLGLILLGLLISIIPTAIVVGLLSYDSNFTTLLDQVMGIDLLEGSAWSHIGAFLLGIPVAMYMYGLWTSCAFAVCRPLTGEHCAEKRKRARVLPQILAFAAMTPMLFVYLIFFISQFKYYTAAFTGVLPRGYSYAEYARSGFFELCAVIAVNGIMVLLLFLLVRRSGRNGLARLYTALLSLSTLILAVTAASKMLLYVDAYGLTLRRVSTLCFILAMALVFLVLLLQTVIPKLPVVPVSLTVIFVLFGGLMLSNTPAWISHYNTTQILAGADWELDHTYFDQLGDAAVADAVTLEKSEQVDAQTREAARNFLNRWERWEKEEAPRLSEYSLNHIRAEQAIKNREPFRGVSLRTE